MEEASNTTIIIIGNLDFALGGNVKVPVNDKDMLHKENANPVFEKQYKFQKVVYPSSWINFLRESK
ncbi:hypothetical protein IFO69_03140 [Echinicola sp. CAU 1574]|uniref:Uncharacterized protein n=1 Tax=Echinicola arenosa TaxID=2774144 RepID=A0ABR9AG55_9BACT|nr:hypothetical protein [Echinicola arenosa]MBD8487736.1 hypothetical protein [Echinicola arenosa]